MANPTGAFGLRLIRSNGGGELRTIPCSISANYATALFVGDPVTISATLADRDSTARYPTIIAATAGDGNRVIGVITSFEPLPTDLSKNYNPASTARVAQVCVDPNAVYEVRGDGSGTPAASWVFANANLVSGSGSTTTGKSGWALDESTPSADQSNQLLIVGASSRVDESNLEDYTLWEVQLNTQFDTVGKVLGIFAT